MSNEKPTIETEIALIKQSQTRSEECIHTILKILQGNGNGEKGLVTQVAVVKSSLRRVWITICGIPTIVGIILAIIKFL